MDGEAGTGRVGGSGLDRIVRRRTRILCWFFLLWILAAAARAWYIAVPQRRHFIAEGEKTARREFLIPAQRGKILDADGVRLVWSERFYDLAAAVDDGECLSAEELRILGEAVPGIQSGSGVLRRALTPDEVMKLEVPIKSSRVRARIVPRDERLTVDAPAIRRRSGEVIRRDDAWHGVSGWELEFDSELAGEPGCFTVLLDRRRDWISSTLKVVRTPTPGRDVRLPHTLKELTAEGGEKR